MFPAEEAQVEGGAIIVADGNGLIRIKYLPEETLHPPLALVTFTESVTRPAAPAV